MIQQNGKIQRYGLLLLMSMMLVVAWSCGQKNEQPVSNQLIRDQNDSIARAEFDSLSQSFETDSIDMDTIQ